MLFPQRQNVSRLPAAEGLPRLGGDEGDAVPD
jgi:hypothetical protein